jgi:hypothetical protein
MQRTLPAGFIAPCLPTKTDKLPSGDGWLHEIKHDGFRIIARKKGVQVRLYSRPGNDLTRRFPLIVEALARLRPRSCIIDGEAVACDDNGVASFDLIRHHSHNDRVFLYAFDLIELNGNDMRRDPPEVRKATLRSMLAKAGLGLRCDIVCNECKSVIATLHGPSAYRAGGRTDRAEKARAMAGQEIDPSAKNGNAASGGFSRGPKSSEMFAAKEDGNDHDENSFHLPR